MFLLFFLLWLVLSGSADLHVCLWGLAAAGLITWFCRQVLGYDWHILLGDPRKLWAMARYFTHLVVEMLKAGMTVIRLVYTTPKGIESKLIWFRTPLRTDRHRALLSDSITLTAGTITVRAEGDRLLVHALDAPLGEEIENSSFQQRLEKMEESPWSK